ncbi:phage tail tube protein FII [Roseibium sp. TrichSKD4]|uniref:phage major tail tube protein n=1 Tax=Roseibium sp. TrichSKD4 TaxID=744980 RepID=UPI0001E575F6|nr:phage major tail tube protein [Roseibium sp. TrichSKD4]EFO30925.1 phage tail tube protein FII [Roseibium sp. TrichSKD4]
MEFGKKLSDFTVWIDDADLGGTVSNVKPTIKRKNEGRRPGGTRGPLVTTHGFEELKMELTFNTMEPKLFDMLVGQKVGQHALFARGAVIDEFEGTTETVVHEIRGRCLNPDFDEEWKSGEDLELKLEFALIFYRHEYAGKERKYIDLRNNIVRMNGFDETAEANAALGRS